MKETYRTINQIAVDKEVKEKLIRQELEKRIKKCEEMLNETLLGKFYQKSTNKL